MSMTTSSAELVSHDDILTQILLRLPIRSIVRFKCVSNHWRHLLSSPRFALLHRNFNANRMIPSGLFIRRNICFSSNFWEEEETYYVFVSLDPEKPVQPPFKSLDYMKSFDRMQDLFPSTRAGMIKVMQSSNGLLLIRTQTEDNYYYYVYNPTINQCTAVPEFDRDDRFDSVVCGMTLVFDPLKSPHYKLVCLRTYLNLVSGLIEVYSSETKSWVSSVKHVPKTDCRLYFQSIAGVYWNGAIHWACRNWIIYLKINESRNGIISLPVPPYKFDQPWWRSYPPLVESRDSLMLFDTFRSRGDDVDVYTLNTDYSGWSKKYHVNIVSDFATSVGEYLGSSYVIHSFFPGVRDDDAFLVIETPSKAVIRYNFVSNTFQKLCDLDSST
ncbi:F-box protein At5g07610-like [Rutidosis leptorrhynchoides]|uniref:F-box protein At5g07610-like n=1 Tax=Rutidosis leptorrhynchoides TaxID=125765 RepID=UPI003A991360